MIFEQKWTGMNVTKNDGEFPQRFRVISSLTMQRQRGGPIISMQTTAECLKALRMMSGAIVPSLTINVKRERACGFTQTRLPLRDFAQRQAFNEARGFFFRELRLSLRRIFRKVIIY